MRIWGELDDCSSRRYGANWGLKQVSEIYLDYYISIPSCDRLLYSVKSCYYHPPWRCGLPGIVRFSVLSLGKVDTPFCPCDPATIQSGDHLTFSCRLLQQVRRSLIGNRSTWIDLDLPRWIGEDPDNREDGIELFFSHLFKYLTNWSSSSSSLLLLLSCIFQCPLFHRLDVRSVGTLDLRGNPINWAALEPTSALACGIP